MNKHSSKAIRILVASLLIVLVPIAYYTAAFLDGYNSRIGLRGMVWLLLAPWIVAALVAWLCPVGKMRHRILVFVATAVLSFFLTLLTAPPPYETYLRGFEYAVERQVGMEKLQAWAQVTLDDFHEGTSVDGKQPSSGNPVEVALEPHELPEFLKIGVFSLSEIPDYGPEISIRANQKHFKAGGECIAISWHDHGLLIGRSDFESEAVSGYWNEIRPGVYSYQMGK